MSHFAVLAGSCGAAAASEPSLAELVGSTPQTDTANSLTFAHETPAGDNRRIVVFSAATGNPSPNGVTYNGVPLVEFRANYSGSPPYVEIHAYVLSAPSVGTHDVVCSFSGSTDVAAIALALNNAPQVDDELIGNGFRSTLILRVDAGGHVLTTLDENSLPTQPGDLVIAAGIVQTVQDPIYDAPLVAYASVDLANDAGTLFVAQGPATDPGTETVTGFTVEADIHTVALFLAENPAS